LVGGCPKVVDAPVRLHSLTVPKSRPVSTYPTQMYKHSKGDLKAKIKAVKHINFIELKN